ncbi:hypothetical protein PInf_019719 [Phytophthora infestans]|nr:hypothetical protein PInf_019398 [Phytophthora infestans]KAI9989436.1 hypothetical protein PInf_019719 [Phytophthora infestans]
MVKLFCAIVGVAGSEFSVEVGEGKTVDYLITAKNPYKIRCDAYKLQLFLAKTADRAWLTQLDALEGVRDTNGCTQLQFVDAKLRAVGLASRELGVMTEEEAAVEKGHVHVLVLVPPPNVGSKRPADDEFDEFVKRLRSVESELAAYRPKTLNHFEKLSVHQDEFTLDKIKELMKTVDEDRIVIVGSPGYAKLTNRATETDLRTIERYDTPIAKLVKEQYL